MLHSGNERRDILARLMLYLKFSGAAALSVNHTLSSFICARKLTASKAALEALQLFWCGEERGRVMFDLNKIGYLLHLAAV